MASGEAARRERVMMAKRVEDERTECVARINTAAGMADEVAWQHAYLLTTAEKKTLIRMTTELDALRDKVKVRGLRWQWSRAICVEDNAGQHEINDAGTDCYDCGAVAIVKRQ